MTAPTPAHASASADHSTSARPTSRSRLGAVLGLAIVMVVAGLVAAAPASTVVAADTTPPSAPGNPEASDLACDSVVFTWEAATDDVGVTGYDLYHDGQVIDRLEGTATTATIELVPGTAWGLYVNARDAAGNISDSSDTVSVDPPPCEEDTEDPTAPSGLEATGSGTSVELAWSAATDNVGVTSYSVRRDGEQVGEVSGNPPTTSFVDTGLEPSTTYTYTVVAIDAQDNESPPSESADGETGVACEDAICDVSEVAEDNDIPWGFVELPDGQVLYNRRDAHDIVRLDPDTGDATSIGEVEKVEGTDGEGGLTGLAISPDFATDDWLYIMHSTADDNRVVRVKYTDGELKTTTTEVLVDGIERSKFHDGGRLRFGPDGKLYIATGDAEDDDSAQELDSLNGKILRINPDGSVPSDNPFDNEIWSYGHRNPQGLAFDAEGRLWQQEFGDGAMDETNLVTKGGNYGWPACEGTEGDCDQAGYVAPKKTYAPTSANSCSGIAVVDGKLWIACLKGEKLMRHTIDGTDLTDQTAYFQGTYGRLRTVEPTSDGGLWLTTSTQGDKDSTPENSDEKILKVTLGDG